MFDFRKYMLRIVLLLILIIFFCLYIQEELIKSYHHNIELNSAIILVFLIGTFLSINNIITLNREQGWLNNFTNEKKTSINYVPKYLDDFKKLWQTDLLFKQKAKEVIERVLEKLDNERELLKYIISLLIFLGLIGTFWGLLKTIDSVGATISNLSIDEENILTNFMNLKEGLNEPLAGMGTAFSSSLFGLSGSLCLGFIDLQCNRAQNDFINVLESKVENKKNNNDIKHEDVGKEYIQAILLQTIESLNNLEKVILRSEESRKYFEDLVIESSKVMVKINNEINLRVGQYNKNELANIETLRSLELQLKDLKEQVNNNSNSNELAKEIQILAKTISLIKK